MMKLFPKLKKNSFYWVGFIVTVIAIFISETVWYWYFRQAFGSTPSGDKLFFIYFLLSGAIIFALIFLYFVSRMDSEVKKEQDRFQSIVKAVKDGILIMNDDRSIVFMNEAAKEMTGWNVGENVPFCSYCKSRDLMPGEERCLLANPEALSYFEADMPVYEGKKQRTFEMSTAFIDKLKDNKRQRILVMRDNELKKNEERAKFAQVLIHETLAAQEAERKRIAQELHDGIGQSLYSIYIGLKGIEAQNKQKGVSQYFTILDKTLQNVIHEVKTLSYELGPATLDMLGLVASLQTLIEFLREQTGKDIKLINEINEERRFRAHMELHLYRIVQEALHNAAKYSKATQITIRIKEEDGKLQLEIADNGKGFVPGKEGQGLGLKHMKERASLLGGHLEIYSSPTEGTQIICRVPVKGDK